MKLSDINYPVEFLAALRNGDLVVFAGAGVSKGSPACLPDFQELAEEIARGTGKCVNTPLDRFLGDLDREGVQIHLRAADCLRSKRARPTSLHRDLLRLFLASGKQRVVTTNFDELFEEVAILNREELGRLALYRAPALPRGKDFVGLAHVHGALNRPEDMVLTDRDFARAYLTEGWARDFLSDLFENHPVLFVGYSHSETLMDYLARALPPQETKLRWVLYGDKQPNTERWNDLGVQVISFPQNTADDFSALDEGIAVLAEYAKRGWKEWKCVIASLVQDPPQEHDAESLDQVADIMSQDEGVRLFTEANPSVEWITWLDEKGFLAKCFEVDQFMEPNFLLRGWLSLFMYSHPRELGSLLERYKMRLHPAFWRVLMRNLSPDNDCNWNSRAFMRWISILIDTWPANIKDTEGISLDSVMACCVEHQLFACWLRIFDRMLDQHLRLEADIEWPNECEQPSIRGQEQSRQSRSVLEYQFRKWYDEGLRPGWPEVAEPVLRCGVRHLENLHLVWQAWQRPEQSNQVAYRTDGIRAAIEPHDRDQKQGRYAGLVNLLIDIVRDALECLAVHSPKAIPQLCTTLAQSDSPLLQRLAIHGIYVTQVLDADDKIQWLLQHGALHERNSHHEQYRLVCQAYIDAGPAVRARFLEILCSKPEDPNSWQTESYWSRRFSLWLFGLQKVASDCSVLLSKLEQLLQTYPDMLPVPEPEFYNGLPMPKAGYIEPAVTAEELLAQPAVHWLPRLLASESDPHFRGDHLALGRSVTDAVLKSPAWGWDLADALVSEAKGIAYLWSSLLIAWRQIDMDPKDCGKALKYIEQIQSVRELADENCNLAITWLLDRLARQAYIHSDFLSLLPKAHRLAEQLWECLDRMEPVEQVPYWNMKTPNLGDREASWIGRSANHPAGVLCHFWIQGLGASHQHTATADAASADGYKLQLEHVLADSSWFRHLGGLVLASRCEELLRWESKWTLEYVLPLLRTSDSGMFRASWVGFLSDEMEPPSAVPQLRACLFHALPRIREELNQNQQYQFIGYYLEMFHLFPDEAKEKWIPNIFRLDDEELRHLFARAITGALSIWSLQHRQQAWSCWLKRYWRERVLHNVPAPGFDTIEVQNSLLWLQHLPFAFPDAVDLAVEMPFQQGQVFWHALTPLADPHVSQEPSLVQQYPAAVAKLLVAIGSYSVSDYGWHLDGRAIIDQLMSSDCVPAHYKDKLEELTIQVGLK